MSSVNMTKHIQRMHLCLVQQVVKLTDLIIGITAVKDPQLLFVLLVITPIKPRVAGSFILSVACLFTVVFNQKQSATFQVVKLSKCRVRK